MHAVVFTGGMYVPHKELAQIIHKASLIIAADSGANTAVKLGIMPSVVIGDMDSIKPQTKRILEKQKTIFITHPKEKDETDTELALDYAAAQKATHITILGGMIGNRTDHILSNILLTQKYKQKIIFSSGTQTLQVVKGPTTVRLHAEKNDLLSLIPLSEKVTNITTTGLYYALKNDSLTSVSPRGVSNVFVKERGTLTFKKGTLCIIHTIRDVAA